jgi:lipopolysaccharide export system permease protein
MNLIERYIFRSSAGAFLAALAVLTAIVWVTQALREVDLITSQGQTLWLFLYLTVLALPALIMVLAPIALFIACLHVLNRLNADSELVVVNAAGVRQWYVAKPFVILGVLVTLLTASISTVLMPESARTLRNLTTQIRADLLAFLIVEGRFSRVEQGLTFHVRERQPDGALHGLLVHDARDPVRTLTYLAETGRILRDGDNAYLIMRGGSLHQSGEGPEELSVVTFDRYVFDLSSLAQRTAAVSYHPREMRMSELLDPDPENFHYQRAPGRFWTEFHDRLATTLYPLAFVFIALAALGRPLTNRQGRGSYLLLAIVAVVGLRGAGFAATNLSVTQPWAVALMYGLPLSAIAAAVRLNIANRLVRSERATGLATAANRLSESLSGLLPARPAGLPPTRRRQ